MHTKAVKRFKATCICQWGILLVWIMVSSVMMPQKATVIRSSMRTFSFIKGPSLSIGADLVKKRGKIKYSLGLKSDGRYG